MGGPTSLSSTPKHKTSYQTVLQWLHIRCPLLDPTLIITDFEKAELWTCKRVYPSVRIQGCNFHYNQLQLKQFRKISDYHSNEVLRIHLRCVYGLPFIPLTDLMAAWTELKAAIWSCCQTPAISAYITYFEKNWIFSSVSPPSLWNCSALSHMPGLGGFQFP